MIVRIDPASAVPPFEQLRTQLATMIESGALGPGHRLPTVRQLARDLDLANGTVARAYRELDAAGLVTANGRHGTVVASATPMSSADRRARLRDTADAFVRAARQLGASDEDVSVALRRAGLSPGSGG